MLSTLIVDKEINVTGSTTISSNRFIQLATEINTLFPNETTNIFYVPYNNISKRLASGKLYDSLNFLKRKIKKNAPKPEKIVVEITGDLESKLKYLKSYSQVFKISANYWKSTHQLRFSSTETQSIFDYMETFTALKSPKGHKLFVIDFDILYPEHETRFFIKWSETFEKILKLVKNSSVRSDLKHQLEIYSNDSQIDALILLPFLFSPTYTKKSKESTKTRFTSVEMQQSFCVHLKV